MAACFEVPDAVAKRARSHGAAGLNWMASLDEQVRALEEEWHLHATEMLTGGSEALVLVVTTDDGRDAVLKLGLPGSGDLMHEADVLRIARGRGYAELLAADARANALLMERLGPPIVDALPADVQLEAMWRTLMSAWAPIDEAVPFMTGSQKADWLAEFISRLWHTLAEPCAEATVARALEFIAARKAAHDPETCVLVHGDPHEHNTLTLADRPADARHCKLIDPDGLAAEPAYDLGVLIRGDNETLLAGDAAALGRRRAEALAAATSVDAEAIWQWGFIERVSTGLHLIELDMTDEGVDTLRVADYWVDA